MCTRAGITTTKEANCLSPGPRGGAVTCTNTRARAAAADWIEFFRGRDPIASAVDQALACELLEQPSQLWEEAGELGFLPRCKGISPKTVDLLIAVYALTHFAELLTADKDFAAIEKVGTGLRLA